MTAVSFFITPHARLKTSLISPSVVSFPRLFDEDSFWAFSNFGLVLKEKGKRFHFKDCSFKRMALLMALFIPWGEMSWVAA